MRSFESTRLVALVAAGIALAPSPCFGSAPPNDACDSALPLFDPGAGFDEPRARFGDTTNATLEGINLCGENLVNSPGVWYSYANDGPSDAIVHVTTCGNDTDFDTALTVFVASPSSSSDASSCESLTCVHGKDDDAECDHGEGDLKGAHASIAWRASAGATYYVNVHGSEADHVGKFGLTARLTEPLDAPAAPAPSPAKSGALGGGGSVRAGVVVVAAFAAMFTLAVA